MLLDKTPGFTSITAKVQLLFHKFRVAFQLDLLFNQLDLLKDARVDLFFEIAQSLASRPSKLGTSNTKPFICMISNEMFVEINSFLLSQVFFFQLSILNLETIKLRIFFVEAVDVVDQSTELAFMVVIFLCQGFNMAKSAFLASTITISSRQGAGIVVRTQLCLKPSLVVQERWKYHSTLEKYKYLLNSIRTQQYLFGLQKRFYMKGFLNYKSSFAKYKDQMSPYAIYMFYRFHKTSFLFRWLHRLKSKEIWSAVLLTDRLPRWSFLCRILSFVLLKQVIAVSIHISTLYLTFRFCKTQQVEKNNNSTYMLTDQKIFIQQCHDRI